MGKLIISSHITVDGVIGPDPSAWAILEGEGERYKFDQLLAADAFLLGRKVYEGLASVWHGHTEAARVLLAAGVRTDVVGHDGRTPLDLARDSGYDDIVALLS